MKFLVQFVRLCVVLAFVRSDANFNAKTLFGYKKQFIHDLKPPVPGFIGRVDELSLIAWKHNQNSHVVVSGSPGIGKTELARKYAMDIFPNGGNIFWINSKNDTVLVNSLRNASKLIGYKQDDKKLTVFLNAVPYYFIHKPTLFIFDGATSNNYYINKLIGNLKNNTGIKLLITSRNDNWDEEKFFSFPLFAFKFEEKLNYIKENLHYSYQSVREEKIRLLAEKLDGTPYKMRRAVYLMNFFLDKPYNPNYIVDYLLGQLKQQEEKRMTVLYNSKMGSKIPLTKTQLYAITYFTNKYGGMNHSKHIYKDRAKFEPIIGDIHAH